MEAYADPLQYFEPDPPNDVSPKEVLEKLQNNDGETKDVNLNNVMGISETMFCDIFNALKNNDKCVKFSACNTDVSSFGSPKSSITFFLFSPFFTLFSILHSVSSRWATWRSPPSAPSSRRIPPSSP